MNTLFHGATYEYSGDKVIVEGKCVFTKDFYKVVVPREGFDKWIGGEALIQNALVGVSASDREFLISGISPNGWSHTFEIGG
jgi:hypothetical protein